MDTVGTLREIRDPPLPEQALAAPKLIGGFRVQLLLRSAGPGVPAEGDRVNEVSQETVDAGKYGRGPAATLGATRSPTGAQGPGGSSEGAALAACMLMRPAGLKRLGGDRRAILDRACSSA
jgi:hypothetical protein